MFDEFKNQINELTKKAYEDGMNIAWEAAKKIYMNPSDGGLDSSTLHKIFDYHLSNGVVKNFTVYEVVKRIKEWEESQIRLRSGDVLHSKFDDCDGIVVNVEDGRYDLVQTDGHTCILSESDLKNYWEKTDKHFNQIEEVLTKMQEVEN